MKPLHDRKFQVLFELKVTFRFSQVTFLLDAEYSSTKLSQQMHSASTHLRQKFDAVKLAELDLAQAHQAHIEKSSRKKEEEEAEE